MDIRDFLARHLNDHEESARGVRQSTFFTWSKAHVEEAVEVALAFLYSLVPDKFGKVEEFKVEKEDCIMSFCEDCGKFLGLVDLEIDGKKCIKLSESENNTNSLLGLFDIHCSDGDPAEEEYSWSYVDNSTCVLKFDKPVPVGSTFRYLCSRMPELSEIMDSRLAEYLPIIAEYAAFWLFRTDSESKSNIERAGLHYTALKFLVETKLLIEFSLREDDYLFGRRKVDD